jgi:hypothetical protein
MTKSGNRGLRTLIIHGARSVMRWAHKRHDALGIWLKRLSGNVISSADLGIYTAQTIMAHQTKCTVFSLFPLTDIMVLTILSGLNYTQAHQLMEIGRHARSA